MKRDDLLCLARLAVQIARTQMPDYANKFAPEALSATVAAGLSVPEDMAAPGLSKW
jgi:hypothetical protein